ncbi:hypothetical protein PAMP_002237 [Pampus punctatissimus]
MKTFSVAVAVGVAIAFICIQESSAVPFIGEQELEEVMSNDSPVTENQEMLMDSWKMPYYRQKRSPIDCRICCGCNGCHPDFCGLCCRT